MCVGRLFLLVVLCLAAVASATNNKHWPLKMEIDIPKCVATRQNKNFYMCIMKNECYDHFLRNKDYYMQDSGDGNKDRKFDYDSFDYDKHCLHGFSIRPITSTRWEIEVVWPTTKDKATPFTLMTSEMRGTTPIDIVLFQIKNAKPEEPIPQHTATNPAIGECKLDTILLHEPEREPKRPKFYMRLEFECELLKELKSVKGIFDDDKWPIDGDTHLKGEGKEIIFDKNNHYMHFPCKELTVLRTKPLDNKHRTEYPVLAADHNVYDFYRMCRNVFKDMKQDEYGPYHNGSWITSIECLPDKDNAEKDGVIPPYNDALPNQYWAFYLEGKREIIPDIIEVTCRAKREHCFYCGDLTSPEFVPPNSTYERIKFNSNNGADNCPSLSCASGLFMFPQINIPTREAPTCFLNKTAGYQWSITQHDPDAWTRKRVPLTGGYCWNKGKCEPLPASRLKCPEDWKGRERCAEPTLNTTQSYTCPDGRILYATFTRRIPLEPVLSVSCNEGEFEVTTFEGVKIKGFTDESWLICKRRPGRPKREPNVVKKAHPVWRGLFGAAIGVGIYVALLGVFLILRIPYVMMRDFWEATEVPPEYSPSAVERREKEAAAAAISSKKVAEASGGGVGGVKKPLLKKGNPPPRVPPYRPPTRPVPSPLVPPSSNPMPPELRNRRSDKKSDSATAAAAANSAKKKDTEEKTCIEPTKSELEILIEQDRLKDCTSEDDLTGKDVKQIEKED